MALPVFDLEDSSSTPFKDANSLGIADDSSSIGNGKE